MKTLAKRIAGSTASRVGLIRRRQGQRALIFMLHRVLSEADYAQLRFQRSLAMTQEGLDLLIRFLNRHYTLIQVDDYLALPDTLVRKERFACLTFDDGWVDNFTHAWPVLSSHQCQASIYLSTGFIGTHRHFWWQAWGDALEAQSATEFADTRRKLADIAPLPDNATTVDTVIEAGKSFSEAQRSAITHMLAANGNAPDSHGLSWEQVKSMSASNLIRFGTHTVNHVLLPQLDTPSARHEIIECADTIKKQPDVCFNQVFCYPNGDHDVRIESLVKEAGYTAALGTQRGFASRDTGQRFHLPRVNITEAQVRDTALFQYRLLKAAASQEA
jgi:peptidoglycan/xylan/chitin deacetylase (PgdA/CDA1 family)